MSQPGPGGQPWQQPWTGQPQWTPEQHQQYWAAQPPGPVPPQWTPEQRTPEQWTPEQHQQYWAAQPPGPVAPQWGQPAADYRVPGPHLGVHLRRALEWNVRDVAITPRERQRLEAAGVTEPRLQGLLAWRRSALLVVLPALLLSVVLSFVQTAQSDSSSLTGFGQLCNWLPAIALLIIPLAVVRVLATWTEIRSTSKLLIICWVLSIAIPLLVALVPIDALVDLDSLRARATDSSQLSEIEGIIFAGRVELAINYAMTLLPVIISVPSGVLKGATRVKSLFPAASLPGWFLVSVAPFYSVFMIVVFVLIDQIVGNGLLLVGVGLLAFSPWLFVVYRKSYSRPLSSAEAKTELSKASRVGGIVTIAGLLCVLIALLTARVEGKDVVGLHADSSVFTYLQVTRTAVEVLARSLVTTVVFCMILLMMVLSEWRMLQAMRPEVRVEHDSEMQSLRRYAEGTRPTTGS